MKRPLIAAILGIAGLVLAGCYFLEFSQAADLTATIDEHRTGCNLETDDILAAY